MVVRVNQSVRKVFKSLILGSESWFVVVVGILVLEVVRGGDRLVLGFFGFFWVSVHQVFLNRSVLILKKPKK